MLPNKYVVFESDNIEETEDFLVRNYARMSIGADSVDGGLRIARRFLADVSFDEVRFGFEMCFDSEPMGRVALCRVLSGRIEQAIAGQAIDVVGPGEIALVSLPDLPYSGRMEPARYDLTMFDPDLLNRVATPASGRPGDRVRLVGHRPVSAAAARHLDATMTYVRETLLSQDEATPLLTSSLANLLASVMVATMPTNARLEPEGPDRADARPAVLRKAMAFIEDNAQSDIALTDVAAAVHVTARTLQYMFRRHLDMTPMEYLRRVRLDHAHHELQHADPAATTVSTIAARWGFGHVGRFSGMYRRVYGRTPSATLRA
ncbi:helix-turn-helix domain-containing protein [Mycolicibacterium phlei]